MSLGIWLGLYILLAFLVGRLYATFVGWKFVRTAFFPGIFLAGTGRLIACWVTGNDAGKCDCWRNAGPVETKGPPPGSTAFRLLFAIAPFALALVGVLAADWALSHPVHFNAELPRLSTDPAHAGRTFFDTCYDFSVGMFHAMKHQELGNLGFWLFIYLAASFIVASSPSSDDMKSVIVACGVAVLGAIVFAFLNNFLGIGLEINAKAAAFWRGLSLLVAYTIFVLVVSGILFLPVKLLRDSRKEK